MKEAIVVCNKMLASHAAILRVSPWKGLPELTNKNGSPCPRQMSRSTGLVYGDHIRCFV